MQRIAQLRREKHLNQVGLAMLLNVSQKMISAYESGTHQPSIETLKKMSKIFNVSVDYIIENTDVPFISKFDSPTGSNEELDKLILMAKRLDSNSRLKVIGYLQGLLDS